MKTRTLNDTFIRPARTGLCIVAIAALGACDGGGSDSAKRDNDERPGQTPELPQPPAPPGPPAPGAPAAPEGLAVVAQSSGSIRITWIDRAGDETGFTLERSAVSAAGGFGELVALPADTQDYIDADSLAPSTRYWYRVRAVRAGIDSAYSNVAGTMTAAPAQDVPAAPASLSATALSSTEVELRWTDTSGDEVGFRIYRADGAGGAFAQAGATASNVTSHRVGGLASGQLHLFRVAAFNNAGESAYSAVEGVSTPAPPLSLPAAPDNLSASKATPSSVRINWRDNADNEDGFEIGVCNGLGGVDGDGNRWCASGFTRVAQTGPDATSRMLHNLSPGTTYTRYVRAFNSAGVSANRQIVFSTEAAQQSLTLTPQSDNLVMVSSQDPSLANQVYAGGELAVGCNWEYSPVTLLQDYVCAQSLMRFDLSALAGAEIESAVLRLEVDYAGVGYYPRDWHLRALASAWSTESITWNGAGTLQYYTASQQLFSAPTYPGQVYDIDVTATVANWVSGSFANNGFVLGSQDYLFPYATSLDAFAFYSSETAAGPRLVISYR